MADKWTYESTKERIATALQSLTHKLDEEYEKIPIYISARLVAIKAKKGLERDEGVNFLSSIRDFGVGNILNDLVREGLAERGGYRTPPEKTSPMIGYRAKTSHNIH